MFRFEREQSVINIGGVRVGGQPGEHPTVLCGTIFYHGQRIVEDEDRGIFDKKRAEELVADQATLSDETGCPSLLHIYARTSDAFERYLHFAEGVWDGPLILDSAEAGVRSEMASLVSEMGLADKSVYNSLGLMTSEKEAEALRVSEVDSAILLAYNPGDSGVEGCLRALEGEKEGGKEGRMGGAPEKTPEGTSEGATDRGLLALARDIGINNILIDPGVPPLGSGAGSALRFSVAAKAKFGLPVGSGIHNAISSWPWLRGKGSHTLKACDAGASAMQILASADFLLYGPIENAGVIFPVAAMTDIMVAEAVRDLDIWPVSGHPINRLV